MRTLALLTLASLPLAAAEPLLKPVTVPPGSTRVQYSLEGQYHHVMALIGKPATKQTGSGEKTVPGKIALGTFMQAPVVATVKRLESWGYAAAHMQTVVIPEITLLGRSVEAKTGKPSEVKVKLKDVKVLAQLYVFVSDDDALGADLWMRVDVLLGSQTAAKGFPRVWLGETRAMDVTYPNSAIAKVEDDKPAAIEPVPTGPDEGQTKITMALTGNYAMPCMRLDGKPFTGAGANKPIAGFAIQNSHENGGLIASKGVAKLFDLKKVDDADGGRVFADGKELKTLNGRVSDLRFGIEGSKKPEEFTNLDQPVLLDQETEPPIIWVGTGWLRTKMDALTLAGDSTGWKLHGYAKTDTITPPVKEKKK